jgi:hypothetical protein
MVYGTIMVIHELQLFHIQTIKAYFQLYDKWLEFLQWNKFLILLFIARCKFLHVFYYG